jgi:hypothetical protein
LLIRFGLPDQFASMLATSCIYRGEYLRTWLRDLLDQYNVRTFAHLRGNDPNSSLPPDQDYRLVVSVSDLSEGTLRRLPWDCARYGSEGDEMKWSTRSVHRGRFPTSSRPSNFVTVWPMPTVGWPMGGCCPTSPLRHSTAATAAHPAGLPSESSYPAGPTLCRASATTSAVLTMSKAMLGTMTGFYDRIHLVSRE